jgi:DNA topoisomerase-1
MRTLPNRGKTVKSGKVRRRPESHRGTRQIQRAGDRIVNEAGKENFVVDTVTTKERKRNPTPPFITRNCSRTRRANSVSPVKKTMMVAQKLYEGIELGNEGAVGLITYMRTDSTRVSDAA